ncbi:hypothetical protein PVL30_003201 [Lodderomyces elongisporus]|uniref:uncharacterized protein n=1 Tax=Lodderomyces elongisporus TaxID=36914 RepID=UPI002920D417|nr:uncharacterized protein PVL30_003201 [Lodderomyces elongisporus]WLF79447.1 hypothetical protein PVL30_003201 [Lodderomyces elongisporus]
MNDLPQMPTPYQQHQQQYPKKHSSSVQQPYSGQKVKYQPPPPPPQQQQQQQQQQQYKAPRTNSSHSVPYQPQQQPQQQQQAYAVPPTPQSQYMYSQQQQQQPQQYAPMPQAPIYHHQQQPQPPMYQHMSSQPQHPQSPLPPQPQQIQQTYASSPQNGAMMYSNPHAAQSVPAPQQHYQLPPQSVSQQQIPQGRHTSSSSQQHFDQNQYIPQSHTSHPVSKKPPPPQQQSSSSQPSQPSQMMMQQTDSPPRMHQHYKQPSNRSKESLSTNNNNNNNNNSTTLTSKQKLEIELRSVFEKVDTNKSGRISAKELSYALLNFDHTRFHESTIKLMLNLFTAQKKSDGSSSSTSSSSYDSSNKSLNFDQFVSLWKYLSAYKKLFIQADADKSGDISFGEFQKILEQIGYKLDIDLVLHLFSKYTAKSDGGLGGGGEIGRLKFDMFIELLIYLRKLTDIFKKYDKDLSGTATIGFSDFLFEISNMS